MLDQQFKRYLGDGIEMNFDGNRVILTGQTGRVYLKPQIVQSFQSALTGLKAELKSKKKIAKTTAEEFFSKQK